MGFSERHCKSKNIIHKERVACKRLNREGLHRDYNHTQNPPTLCRDGAAGLYLRTQRMARYFPAQGIRESILERIADEIKRDVSDMIWLLFGTAVHSILERQEEGAEEIKEARIKVPVGDYILSGQFDLYDAATQTITDYKTTSVWKIIFGDFEDWLGNS